jgi:hypothetical protein
LTSMSGHSDQSIVFFGHSRPPATMISYSLPGGEWRANVWTTPEGAPFDLLLGKNLLANHKTRTSMKTWDAFR